MAYSVDNAGAISVGHADGLGSVRALTDGSGALTQTYLTDPFGAVLSTGGTSAQPFRFTGEQRDDTGLYYLRARVYDPVLGRFLSRDPVFGSTRDPLSLNRYSYVHNNPVNAVDPSGHCLAKITRDDCPGGEQGSEDLTPTNCSDTTSITYFACGDPHAIAVPAGGPAILGPIDPISRIVAAADGGGGGSGGGGGRNPGHHAQSTIPYRDGDKATVSEVLTTAENWLGQGYKETEPGRFVSADGRRVFRMKDSDILGMHGVGGSHVNFETLIENPDRPGRMKVNVNVHVFLTDK